MTVVTEYPFVRCFEANRGSFDSARSTRAIVACVSYSETHCPRASVRRGNGHSRLRAESSRRQKVTEMRGRRVRRSHNRAARVVRPAQRQAPLQPGASSSVTRPAEIE
jgi:hypothetical protein